MDRQVIIAIAVVSGWAIGFIMTMGTHLAFLQRCTDLANDPQGNLDWAHEHYRCDLAFAAFLALTPVGWLITIIVTRFYQSGFQLGGRS